MKISVVIPTYNEAENISNLVSALFTLPLDLHILIVDDDSPDGTGRISDQLANDHPDRLSVIHRRGVRGLRSAYLTGFRRVIDDGAQAIAQMDADFSHDPQVLVGMAKSLEYNDLVLGSRYTEGGSVDARWPLWRKWLSSFGNFYARTILGIPLRDVTTGYRLWRRETLLGMPLEKIASSGYIFLVEMAFLAHILGYRLGEVPIYFADRRWGKSKMSLRIQLEAAYRVWQVKWLHRGIRRKTAR